MFPPRAAGLLPPSMRKPTPAVLSENPAAAVVPVDTPRRPRAVFHYSARHHLAPCKTQTHAAARAPFREPIPACPPPDYFSASPALPRGTSCFHRSPAVASDSTERLLRDIPRLR